MNIDEIIDKIKKAVRLANKTTSENERETALRLARNIAAKNGVAFDEVAEDAGEGDSGKAVIEKDDRPGTRPSNSDLGFVCYILKHHFGVIMILNVNAKNRRAVKMSWVGSRLNIDIARHVYHILVRESARAWREEQRNNTRKEPKADEGWLALLDKPANQKPVDRTSFMRGFFWAISQKLAAHPLRNDLDAAIKGAERRLLEWQQEVGALKHARNGRKGKLDADALIRGIAAGNGVNLARPCENNGGISPLAIGNSGQLRIAAV